MLNAVRIPDGIDDAAGPAIKRVRVILSGTINRAVTVKGLGATRGARAAIEAAGGKVE